MHATTSAEHLDEIRELLRDALGAASYPASGIELIEREGGDIEIVATLLGTAANPEELDQIVASLDRNPMVDSASWSIRTTE